MKKKINTWLLTLAFALMTSLTSCGVWNLDNKIKHLELGMTKQEVFDVLGTSYTSEGAIATPNGNLETISFYGGNFNRDYIVRFLDGKLVEWFIDKPNNTPVPVPVPVHEE